VVETEETPVESLESKIQAVGCRNKLCHKAIEDTDKILAKVPSSGRYTFTHISLIEFV
jgi:hypothetical protein